MSISSFSEAEFVILRQLGKSLGVSPARGADVRSDQLLEGNATDRQINQIKAALNGVTIGLWLVIGMPRG